MRQGALLQVDPLHISGCGGKAHFPLAGFQGVADGRMLGF